MPHTMPCWGNPSAKDTYRCALCERITPGAIESCQAEYDRERERRRTARDGECAHDWVNICSGSHTSKYACSICGAEEWH
ncbi:MAG: hypothetical protein AB7E51_06605 [Pseudodesulfovibrio sp.]|uniref:hypothetical protein n=1 Tax=Pseudodesulfovibrio sp. TaxID=2035812 RepID=UPI003D0F7DCD